MVITSTSHSPFEKIFLDVVGPLPVTESGNKFILTVQDDLTKFALGIPIPNQEAVTVSKAFVKNVICQFGAPQSLLTDQGTNFLSEMFKNVCKQLKIHKQNSTAYQPQTNGALEREHRWLGEYLRNFSANDPSHWDEWIPFAIFVYNSTPHSSHKFMPFELVYGYKPNIPVSMQKPPEPLYNYNDYSFEMKFRLQNTWQIARNNLISAKEIAKKSYDKSTHSTKFEIGDKVLLKNETRSSKFDPPWHGPYEIMEINSEVNSTIQIGRSLKLVHNNRLLRFNE